MSIYQQLRTFDSPTIFNAVDKYINESKIINTAPTFSTLPSGHVPKQFRFAPVNLYKLKEQQYLNLVQVGQVLFLV